METEAGPNRENSPSQAGEPAMSSFPARWNSVFFSSDGIRAGWRLLLAVVVFIMTLTGLGSFPPLRLLLRSLQTGGAITPALLIAGEGIAVIALVLAVAVMALIERRSFADYGWPLSQAFGKLFWLGLPTGFVGLTGLMGLIAAFHGYAPGGLAIQARDGLKFGLLYALGFLLIGIFEEFSFRGYLQSTLASGIGFWPAAIVLAIAFGAQHLTNPGEARLGAVSVGAFGLLMAFSLRRTGNLWFAIAAHAAWDWGETFFYSVPDSGVTAAGHLLNSSLAGPNWLTGGSMGPEGSVLVFPVLLLLALAIHFVFPPRRTAR